MAKFYFDKVLKDVIKIHASIENRSNFSEFRTDILNNVPNKLIKKAFDTRRINQQDDYNPRRNLQYYHRSDPFISKNASENIKTFFKLKIAVDSVKEDFIGDPDFLDSYCRILSCALDRTLRIKQNDTDFFQPQMDYLNELLYLRYRLKPDDIEKLNEKELRNIILDRDEKLLHKQIFANYNNGGINKNSATSQIIKGNDTLIDKLFSDVKASAENRNVERSVTISIKDKIIDDQQKE